VFPSYLPCGEITVNAYYAAATCKVKHLKAARAGGERPTSKTAPAPGTAEVDPRELGPSDSPGARAPTIGSKRPGELPSAIGRGEISGPPPFDSSSLGTVDDVDEWHESQEWDGTVPGDPECDCEAVYEGEGGGRYSKWAGACTSAYQGRCGIDYYVGIPIDCAYEGSTADTSTASSGKCKCTVACYCTNNKYGEMRYHGDTTGKIDAC